MGTKKVLVAMSGGIDSSVAAYHLKKSGYEVIGVTLQLWNGDSHTRADDAKKVAVKLGIPHFLLDVKEIFREKIIDNFCKEYKKGRTPNPCISCNQYIKFSYLLKKAQELGIEFVATGHYARIEYDKGSQRYLLKKGIDLKKEQSYVLYTLKQNQLAKILMPLGDYTKEEVKKAARRLKLSALVRKESQEICFVPGKDYRKFLKGWITEKFLPGSILNSEGKKLGTHSGIAFYTVGQRKGLGISNKEALYVTAIDSKNNTIFVGTEKNLYQNKLIAKEVNYIYMRKIPQNFVVKAKIRYLHREMEAKLIPRKGKTVRVKFKERQRAITPGQAVVFYDGDIVIGGGIIREVI